MLGKKFTKDERRMTMINYRGFDQVYESLKDGKKLCKENEEDMPYYPTTHGFFRILYYVVVDNLMHVGVRLENGEQYTQELSLNQLKHGIWFDYDDLQKYRQPKEYTVKQLEHILGCKIKIVG